MFVLKLTVTVLKHPCYSVIYKRFLNSKVRVRFAPSPTGFLHLGGLRTALCNHLFAKSNNGESILRIEDTDLTRKVPQAAENLIEDLAWFGITFDEGPYFQSERKEIYQKYAKQLIEQGDAYYCFCSNLRLNLVRKEAIKSGGNPGYDNKCRYLTKEEIDNNLKTTTPCIRFKLRSFSDTFNDLVSGCMTVCDLSTQEGDFVILKADGFPTYHFANVIDDHLMKITHVLRGVEWLMSTTKHLLIYKALKWDPPYFGHLPLLMNEDGTKLSKRHNHLNIRNLIKDGYFPNSLINFIARMGGGCEIKSDKNIHIYTLNELIEKFDISKMKSSSCKVNIDMLPVFNHAEFIRQFESANERSNIVKKVKEIVQNSFPNSECENLLIDDKRVELILDSVKHRILYLKDVVRDDFIYLWKWENKWEDTDEVYNNIIRCLVDKIEEVNWNLEDIKKFLNIFCTNFKEFKYADIMQKLRLALTGKKVGHSVAEIMSALSREDVRFRLTEVLKSKSRRIRQN